MDAEEVRQLRVGFTRRLPVLTLVAEQLEGLANTGLSTYAHQHSDRIYFRVKPIGSFVGKVKKRADDASRAVECGKTPVLAYVNALVQVRTLFMHAWAEPQHDLAYRSSVELTNDEKRLLAWVAASAWGADQGLDDAWNEIGAPD